MAKVKINSRQLKKITKNLQKRFDDFTEDKKELNKAGEIILREIKANSRQGVGYDGESLPSLSSSWDKRRKRLASVNNTSRFYDSSPARSTVSFLGDTINKLKYRIEGAKIEVFGEGNHRRIKGIRVNFLEGSNSPISDILSGLKEKGYKILGVSDKARDQIRTNFIRFIRRKLR